jgi:sulfur carrier protein ThiS
MVIEVKVYEYLRHYVSVSEKLIQGDKWNIPEGTSVGQLLETLNFPPQLGIVLLVNSVVVNRDRILKEGDILNVLPLLAGG